MDTNQPAPAQPAELTDEELLRTYGAAKRNHCYEGDLDDWPNRAERAATVAGLRAAIAADRARRATPARLRHCPTHGQQPPEAWGCPECLRELREELATARLQQQPVSPAEGEAGELAAELRHFLAGYQQMRGLDPECIYSIHRGDAMEAHLKVSRLTRAAALLKQQSLQPVGAITAAEAERLAHEAGFSAVDSDENELRQTFVVWEATTAQLTAVVNAAIAFDRARRAAPPAKGEVGELAECREALRRVRLQQLIPGGGW